MVLKKIPQSLLLLVGALVLITSCAKKEETGRKLTGNPKIDKLKLPDGFEAELLYSPGENDQGSWVAMTFDDKGRMITSDQYGFLYRLELPPIGSDSTVKPKVEKLIVGNVPDSLVGMGYAQGLLYAFNSLYVMVNHNPNETFSQPTGLYRIQDLDGDDQFETITQIRELKGQQGEHGPHSMKLTPDGKGIYLIAGNHVDVPEMNSYRLPRVWNEDNLFPLIKDPRGHANSRMAPGGWIARIDPEGKDWELIGAGFRNAFDFDYNEVGDIFAYDADMEWDFGMPWYRPTRINHVTSGAEFGWRTGNSKWSPNYPDNLPAILNIGQGSPTNAMFGYGANFPSKYKKALYAFDWSFGIIYAIHLTPNGATYDASAEEFISGSPLPLTDGIIGPDGAFYFATGGRRLESDLYRVTYKGELDTYTPMTEADLPEAAKIRRDLEQYHKEGAPAEGLEKAWAQLNNPDRYVQYAARIVLEHQPVASWKDKAIAETDPVKKIHAILALAHHATDADAAAMLNSLMQIGFKTLSTKDRQDLLRTIEVILYRYDKGAESVKSQLVAYLDPNFPANDNMLDRSLSILMVHLDAPSAVEKTLALLRNAKDDPDYQKTFTASSDLIFRNPQYGMDIANMLANVPPAQATFYATVLGGADKGWTTHEREEYFSWVKNALTQYKGGRSYVGFLDRARKMALASVDKAEFEKYDELSGGKLLTANGNDIVNSGVQPEGPGRRWTLEEAEPLVANLVGRDLVKGKAMYSAVLCQSCHTMQGEGGVIGPDLTQLGTRFSPKDILVATINPSETISDQYHATVLELKEGGSIVGKLNDEDEQNYYISQNPFAPDLIKTVPKNTVVLKKNAEVSIMMPGLINRLNEEELKDLIAYLVSGGNPDHAVYKNQATAQK
ncbi:putative heme-binding domain-containing protein [Algoriphagus boseongensis]|uniref:Putative heme-binding domain-containing protein n=1 Tax=Algoriphagus boseongensis TaxID=1442587 RepID=A0A4R6T333_9BACT|nr:c-type cytochrome [Algoriphagus boseongensis]TDQ15093.1 putative heme-binding domain-containing protein [Algoriphagus boseongensis]